MKSEYLTTGPTQTKKLGEALAKEILKEKNRKKAVVLGLVGDLGGGKTTFLQGFAKGLKIKERVLSPTFVIMKRFEIKGKKQFKSFYHIDCYRLEKDRDLLELGFKEMVSDSKNIIAAEWADKTKKLLPKDSILIDFEFIDDKTRRIKIVNIF
jgi:tRNA threonylcarbamoyladenosine biosynthesis protein TsaE